jgi:phosphoenolpyruvate carboxylase
MAELTDPQIRALYSDIGAHLLARAGDPTEERTQVLRQVIKDYLPEVDEFELRRVVEHVATGLRQLATCVEDRRDRLMDDGRAEAYG